MSGREVPACWEPYRDRGMVEVLIGRHVGHDGIAPGEAPHAWVAAEVLGWTAPDFGDRTRRLVRGVRLRIVGGIQVRVVDPKYLRRRG